MTAPSTAVLGSKPFSIQSGKHFDIARSLGSAIGFDVLIKGLSRAVSYYYLTYAIFSYRSCSILL